MTLIAAFEINDTPIIIGDLMLSKSGAKEPHTKLPTIDDPSEILPKDWQHIISGLHRKVCIVHPQVVIAWSGRLDFANHFIQQLNRLLNNKQEMHKAKLVNALLRCKTYLREHAGRDNIGQEELTIIGWIVPASEGACQFEWDWQGIVFHTRESILTRGAGSNNFDRIFNESKSVVNSSDNSTFTIAAMEAVTLVSLLLSIEVSTGSNLLFLYGGGYEIVIFADGSFRFLNEILYVPIFISDLEKDYAIPHDPLIFFKYFYIDGNLAIARKTLKLNKMGDLKSDKVTIFGIRAFEVDRTKLESLDITQQYEFKASIVALMFMSRLENGHIVYAPLVVNGNSKWVEFRGNVFAINKEVFKLVIPNLKKQLDYEYG